MTVGGMNYFTRFQKRTDAKIVNNDYIIKTNRLGGRLWRESDFDEFYKIMSSKLTHIYTSEKVWSVEETKDMINWNINNTDINSGYFNLPLILLDVNSVYLT